MAMINCRECGAEISGDAEACPKCGATCPNKVSYYFSGVIGLIFLAGILLYVFDRPDFYGVVATLKAFYDNIKK